MTQQNPSQVVSAAPGLRLKVGAGRLGAIDPAAIAKAEAALKSLSSNFDQWLQDEIVKLDAAREQVGAQSASPESMEVLYLRAHDLKGLGTTYGYPLITRVAASLCRLIDDKTKRAAASMPLVDAHIQAIKAAVREGMKTDDHPVGAALVAELENQVRDAGC